MLGQRQWSPLGGPARRALPSPSALERSKPDPSLTTPRVEATRQPIIHRPTPQLWPKILARPARGPDPPRPRAVGDGTSGTGGGRPSTSSDGFAHRASAPVRSGGRLDGVGPPSLSPGVQSVAGVSSLSSVCRPALWCVLTRRPRPDLTEGDLSAICSADSSPSSEEGTVTQFRLFLSCSGSRFPPCAPAVPVRSLSGGGWFAWRLSPPPFLPSARVRRASARAIRQRREEGWVAGRAGHEIVMRAFVGRKS